MQRKQMRMKLPLKHDISLCTTFFKDEFRVLSSINDLKLLKAVIAKRSTLGI